MILPVQKRAVREWVAAMLDAAGKAIPLERIINGNADTQTTRPYVQILWPGGTRRGPAPERRTRPGNIHWARTDGTATVSITVVGVAARTSYDDAADAFTVEMLLRVNDYDIASPLYAANLSVQGVTELPNQDALTGQSQWETRASLDITFNTAGVVTSDKGIVETVVIDGTTEPPSPIGTIEISAP